MLLKLSELIFGHYLFEIYQVILITQTTGDIEKKRIFSVIQLEKKTEDPLLKLV